MFSVEATFEFLTPSVALFFLHRRLNWLRHFFPTSCLVPRPFFFSTCTDTAICLPKVHFLTNLSNVTNEKICY